MGLLPFFAKGEKTGYKCINARANTIATSPACREPYKRKQRCLCPRAVSVSGRSIPPENPLLHHECGGVAAGIRLWPADDERARARNEQYPGADRFLQRRLCRRLHNCSRFPKARSRSETLISSFANNLGPIRALLPPPQTLHTPKGPRDTYRRGQAVRPSASVKRG